MFHTLAKLSAFVVGLQLATAAPIKIEIKREQLATITSVQNAYNRSSEQLKSSGLKAFFAVHQDVFNEQDEAFLAARLKGLNPLPSMSVNSDGEIEVKSSHSREAPIKIQYAGSAPNVFLVNQQSVTVLDNDGVEDIYKKVVQAVGQKHSSAFFYLDTLINSLLPKAHAISVTNLVVGGIIAVASAVILFQLGKNSGEKKVQKKWDEQKAKDAAAAAKAAEKAKKQNISETNPTYLETPSADNSSDVVSPGHGQ